MKDVDGLEDDNNNKENHNFFHYNLESGVTKTKT